MSLDGVIRTSDTYGGDTYIEVWARVARGLALACLDRRADALAVIVDALDRIVASTDPSPRDIGEALSVLALAAHPVDASRAATLLGAASTLASASSRHLGEHIDRLEERLTAPLRAAIAVAAWSDAVEAGRAMSVEDAMALARTLAVPARETTA